MRRGAWTTAKNFLDEETIAVEDSAPALLGAPGGGLGRGCRGGHGFSRPQNALVGVFENVRRHCVVGHAQQRSVRVRAEPIRAARFVVAAVGVVHFEIQGVAGDDREKRRVMIQADAPEHAPRRDVFETGKLLEHVVQIFIRDSHLPRIFLPRCRSRNAAARLPHHPDRASTVRAQYLTIIVMNWKPHLPEIFLGISLAMIAVEGALGGISIVKARYRAGDTLASLGMQAGNIAMN